MKKNEFVRVVFRTWKNGEVVALFPDLDWGRGEVASYMHVGQHGGADYAGVVSQTRPAVEEEFRGLASELSGIGYRLRVVRHR